MSNSNSHSPRRRFMKSVAASAVLAASGAVGTFFFHQQSLFAEGPNLQANSQAQSSILGTGINVLLVHGALTDASSWSRVIPLLQAKGYKALAVQLPLTSLEEDIAITRQALATLSGPTIVVGHSYGGAVITSAATNVPNVVGLVYAEAFAPVEGESINTLFAQYPATPLLHHVVPSYRKGYVWCDPSWFPQVFAQDLDLPFARELAITQKPIQPACFAALSGPPAWKKIPSWYLVSTNDHCINPASERFMAKRMGAKTHEIASSHIAPLSHPSEVVELIVEAAKGK